MRPFGDVLPLAEALAQLRAAVVPVSRTERIAVEAAAGRVAAVDVAASCDVPPFDRAAMDGYAVVARDLESASAAQPVALQVAGRTFAGDPPGAAIASGQCVEIATGAPMPPGADAVVMVEHTAVASPGYATMLSAVRPGQNVARRGGDLSAGEFVLLSGEYLSPARVGALSATGVSAVEVYVRPRVLVASTGNEIVPVGAPLGPGQIHDVNRYTLPPIVRAHGGEPVVHPAVADSVQALSAVLDRAVSADLMVLSGGSSVGDRDLLIDAVRERGEIIFHGIAIKPGKPTLLARVGGRLLLGMPGNPTSCLSNAYVLLVPLLRALARLPDHHPVARALPLARAVVGGSGRHQFHSVRIEEGRAVPAFKGSGAITSLSRADGYIEIPAHVERLEAGTVVEVRLFTA